MITNKLRIAMFSDTFKPQINGVVTSIDLFAQELVKKGHDVHIFCPGREFHGQKVNGYRVYGCRWFELKTYRGYRVALPSLKFLALFNHIDPDVVHIHTPAGVGAMGLLFAKIFRKPAVLHFHTMVREYYSYLPMSSHFKGFYVRLIDSFTKFFFNRGNAVIAPSNDTKSFLVQNGIQKRTYVLPTGIASERKIKYTHHARSYYKHHTKTKIVKPASQVSHNKKEFTILHVGRLCRERSVDVVVRAFARLMAMDSSRNYRLVVLSDGPARHELELLAKELGVDNKITFTGFVSNKQKEKIFYTADLFAIASTTDTQGIVLLEAMNHGLPVVAADAGGLRDFVKSGVNGFLFSAGDVDDLAEKIMLISKNKRQNAAFIRNGLETVKKFSMAKCSDKLERIYFQILKNKYTHFVRLK